MVKNGFFCRGTGFILAGFLTMSLILLSGQMGSEAKAWTTRKARLEKNQDKPLTHKQAKSLANKLSSDLLKRKFFSKTELPRKITIALIPVSVSHKEVTDKEFTNMILNNLLGQGNVSIVNQDSQMEDREALNFGLISYDNEWLTRQRGLMLGANYIVSGAVTETLETDEKGHVYRVYSGELSLKNISTNKIIVQETATHNRKKVSKKRAR